MAEDGKIKIDKFDGHDFGFWKMQIEDYLYQKKLHEPLAEAKPTGMKAEDWTLLDRQALGAVRLSLAKNVAYNVVNEKTTYGLFKALSNMYEKPSASNKVFLIRQLVNTKMKEGASVADHVNEFNSILSRLMSVDIKFDDEVQALLLLSSLPESWSGTVTAVSGSTGRAESKTEGRSITEVDRNQRRENQYSKPVTSRDKEVNMAARDYDDALLERFKLRSGKVRLADDKTLDIVGVGDVVLKISFGTSWTLKDVRYIPGLKKNVNHCGALDEEKMVSTPEGITNNDGRSGMDTHLATRARHLNEKVMKILASKSRIPDCTKGYVGFCSHASTTNIPLSMTTTGRVKCLKFDNYREYSSREFIEYYAKNGIRMLKTVSENTLKQNWYCRKNEHRRTLELKSKEV
ncbi:hypothetical protein Tco_0798246 [Tanacetum coccineum]